MKTFVPFSGATPEEGVLRSLLCLDDKRLGKQRVETYQIWKMVRGLPFDNSSRPAGHGSLQPSAWSRHPAVSQWMGYADALALYLLVSCRLWSSRLSPTTGRPFSNAGMQDNIVRWSIEYSEHEPQRRLTFGNTRFPPWWGDARVHDSDKGGLFRKDCSHYRMFRPYAAVYEQYVWPYQIARHDEQARQALLSEDEDGEEKQQPAAEAADGDELHQAAGGVKASRKRQRRSKKKARAALVDEQQQAAVAAVKRAGKRTGQRRDVVLVVSSDEEEKKEKEEAARPLPEDDEMSTGDSRRRGRRRSSRSAAAVAETARLLITSASVERTVRRGRLEAVAALPTSGSEERPTPAGRKHRPEQSA